MALEFAGAAALLSAGDIEAMAASLGCDPAVVHAVCDVESAGSGFLPDRRPKILFEAHSFHQLTGGRYDADWPNISAPSWDRSLYGPGGAHQYDRLEAAIALDRAAALQSASWGMFQIMGSNHAACGYSDVENFVTAIESGERAQLGAFTKFCVAGGLDDDLRTDPPDFTDFARGYNGPGYAANAYDVKLAGAWRKWRAGISHANPAPRSAPELYHATLQRGCRGEAVARLQAALGIAADGDFGEMTEDAVIAFQTAHGLAADGIVGSLTAAALNG